MVVLQYLQNFVAIFAAMALFFAPFVAVFAWRNRQEIRRARPHFNYFMERFFTSPESNALVFTWAAAEAIAWFIIPEFLLVLVIFMKINRKLDLVKYDILGTVCGSVVALGWQIPDSSFRHLPYIRERMLTQVTSWYDDHGVFGLLYQPFSGVPYKVFTHVGGHYHFFVLAFLAVAVAARMVRYVVVYEATKALYPFVHPVVRKHYGVAFVLAAMLFTGLLMRVVALYS